MGDLLRFLDGVFQLRTKRGLRGLLPHLFTDMESHPDWFYVITCGGKIVSHVGVTPLEFVLGERRMTVGAIGHVATHKKFRGKGLMAALLDDVTERMKSANMPVSILWGDRVRYARFGWEPAGIAHYFCVTPRAAAEYLSSYKMPVKRLQNPARHAEEMHALHRLLPFRVERTPRVFSLMLEKETIDVFAVMRRERVAAYAVVAGIDHGGETGKDWIVDEACGDPRAVLGIIRWLAARPGTREVRGRYPLERSPVSECLLGAGLSWDSPISMIGQIKMIDVEGALKGFGLDSFGKRIRSLDYDDRKLVRTIFGPVPPEVNLPPGRACAGLAARLPVGFFLWPSDHC